MRRLLAIGDRYPLHPLRLVRLYNRDEQAIQESLVYRVAGKETENLESGRMIQVKS
jgi:hypothetical protein